MLYRLRQRTGDEGGFTLIELLVVILIIGILAAIAIPAFLSQKSKANDAAAKTQVGTMQTAMETYSTENSGTYAGASVAKLQEIEPTLKEVTNSKPLKAEGRIRSGCHQRHVHAGRQSG
jgi:type IV pilus assembly protein PilA